MQSILIASLAVIGTVVAQTPIIEPEFRWTGHAADGFDPKTMAPLGNYTFAGCYIDSINPADSVLGAPQQQGVGMAYECIQQCGKLNFALAGLQAGSRCYCANNFKKVQKLTSYTECSTPCAYFPWKTCGGDQRLQLYVHTGLVQAGLNRIPRK